MNQGNDCHRINILCSSLLGILGVLCLSFVFAQPAAAAYDAYFESGPSSLANGADGTYVVRCKDGDNKSYTISVTYSPLIYKSGKTSDGIKCDNSQSFSFVLTAPATGSGTVTLEATGTGVTSGSLSVSYGSGGGGGGDLRFGDGSGNTASMLVLGEDGACAVSSQTVQVCLPAGETSGSGGATSTFTLSKGSDPDNLITISPTTITLRNDKTCADDKFTVTRVPNDIASTYHDVPISLTMTSSTNLTPSDYNDAQLTVRVLDDELDRSMWSWELDGAPVSQDVDQRIEGRIKIKSEILPYLCRADFNTTDEKGSTNNAFTDPNSPSYFDPADYPECAGTSMSHCLCTESTWKLKWENLCYDSSTEALKERSACNSGDTILIGLTTDGDGSEVAIVRYDDNTSGGATPFDLSDDRRIPNELPIVAIGKNISSAAEGTCRPAFCLISNNDYPSGQFPSCQGDQPPGATFYYPTFVLTASYDWLHNFYDNNASAATGAADSLTDPDTDNFNKIITIDSNLFPIHSAMQGDQEFPNIVMRNWTSRGAGSVARTSPSANDYMNRSVAAVANYIPEERTILYDYGQTDGIKAKGLRSHMEWVFALDPANNNFRRYKFIKIPDSMPAVTYDNDGLDDTRDMVGQCANADQFSCEYGVVKNNDPGCAQGCKDDAWSIFRADEILVNTCNQNSPDVETWADYDPESLWAAFPKKQGTEGMTSLACPTTDATPTQAEAPGLVFRTYFTAEQILNNSTVPVTLSITGFSHDQSADLRFVLNPNQTDPDTNNCRRSTYTTGGDFTPSGDCPENGGMATFTRTFNTAILGADGGEVSTSCAVQDPEFPEFYYMEFGVYPCQNHGSWVIQLPEPPGPEDKGFQIPTLEDTNPTAWDAITDDTVKQKIINERWANISSYMELMPPESYPGYPSYTALSVANRTIGYGTQTNTSFTTAGNVRFKNPRDIDVYRDYYDVDNEGPAYIFVADTMNSRIQVFMNATASAGDVGATFPIRPVPVKGPNDTSGGTTAHGSNELGKRLYDSTSKESTVFGNGRRADYRGYTTVDGASWGTSLIPEGDGEAGAFFYPHSIAVDQDPDTKDIYLFVADTYNHRIQVFRDLSGVTSQDITNKQFDFEYETAWGSYPLQTTMTPTAPGPFNYRYPKGIDLVRFGNNSSYLYVVDSKDYRVMKYEILENPAGGIRSITAQNGYGYNGTAFATNLTNAMGSPLTADSTLPGFVNPQDVATGYSGFFVADVAGTDQTVFLNNNMVYVTDYARNNTATTDALVNMRVMQFIDIPGQNSPVQNTWIPWGTQAVNFGTYADDNLTLGQSPYGIYGGVHNSSGNIANQQGSSNNIPSTAGVDLFSERPVGISALQWNTLKPIDIRVVPESSGPADSPSDADAYEPAKDVLPRDEVLRIGVSSRVQRFGSPVDKAKSFWNASSQNAPIPRAYGRWDGLLSGRVHFFCYKSDGSFSNHTALHPYSETQMPYNIQLDQFDSGNGCPAGGFVKIVAEDKDFGYSGRSGTAYFKLGN